MRTLAELLEIPDGSAYLAERGIHTDAAEFAERLTPPANGELARLLGVDETAPLVYVGQQVCADIAAPTVAKFETARALAAEHDAQIALLWHDMDSTQSERYGARVVLPAKRARGVWLAPRELEDLEPRFIEVERVRLEAAVEAMGEWARNACQDDRAAARARMELLAGALLDDDIATLADANRALATTLLREHVGLEAPSTFASTMIGDGMLIASLENYLANISDVVRVFNEAVERLIAKDIDPQVKLLRDDYLPLRYSCPLDGTRLRLDREGSGADMRAVATCRCSTHYEFALGDPPQLRELGATGRWGIDVSMPVHHNDLASGWIGGRSGALYAIVFNEVLEKVLGRRPLPVLVPSKLPTNDEADETLLVSYLTAGRSTAGVTAR